MSFQEKQGYTGSEVLILGGGDGGLLKELLELENPPKNVTMIELDDVVMEACSRHMWTVCGQYLDKDKRCGQNYEVITGDAFNYIHKMKVKIPQIDRIFGTKFSLKNGF